MKKNNTLNLMKLICSIMIILIHIKFPETTGKVIAAIARFAVPIFFMISGYFAYKKDNQNKHIKRHIIKLLKLSIITITIYYIYYYHNYYLFLEQLLTIDNLKYFLLFNEVPFENWLWFLFALIYVYIIYFIIKNIKYKYYLIPILLILNIIIGYLTALDVLNLREFVVRNFLLLGLPFFLLGNYLNKYKEKVIKIPNKLLIIITLITIITSVLEFLILGQMELYISSIFLSTSLFIFCINNPNLITENNILAKLGDENSLAIYTSHTMIIYITSKYLKLLNIQKYIIEWIHPIIVILLTISLSIIYYKIKNIIIMLKLNKIKNIKKQLYN